MKSNRSVFSFFTDDNLTFVSRQMGRKRNIKLILGKLKRIKSTSVADLKNLEAQIAVGKREACSNLTFIDTLLKNLSPRPDPAKSCCSRPAEQDVKGGDSMVKMFYLISIGSSSESYSYYSEQ